jgi:mannose-6-phosphate isomerase-like protein (cupin superfamily)
MKVFRLEDLEAARAAQGRPMFEFLREKSMSLSLYTLPPGGPDPQHPHGEDEVYFVTAGRAQVRVGEEDREVGPGSVVFVPARVEHHFHSILETLTVLVVFAPPRKANGR